MCCFPDTIRVASYIYHTILVGCYVWSVKSVSHALSETRKKGHTKLLL
jgi:hypothetical protein